MTALTTIQHNHLLLECRQCCRWRRVPACELIERVGGHRSPEWGAERARCSHCRRGASFQITYVGGSGTAVDGARSQGGGD